MRKNSSEIASFVKIFGATAVGAAVGQFISWMAAARTSVLALNAAMALNPWIAGGMLIAAAGFVGYEQYQNFQNQQKAMEPDIRDATIRNAITNGAWYAHFRLRLTPVLRDHLPFRRSNNGTGFRFSAQPGPTLALSAMSLTQRHTPRRSEAEPR